MKSIVYIVALYIKFEGTNYGWSIKSYLLGCSIHMGSLCAGHIYYCRRTDNIWYTQLKLYSIQYFSLIKFCRDYTCKLLFIIHLLHISVFGVEAYTSASNFSGVILLAIMFCITSILIVYNIEKWFSDPSMGQVGALCIFVLIATMFLVIKMCMDLLWQYDTIAKINYYLSWFFALLPSFALASGLMDIGKFIRRK